MSQKASAIVTDGLWRKSLSTIRSLGKAGFRVSVMGDSVFTSGFWSSFTSHRITAPIASEAPVAFGKALLAAVEKEMHKNDVKPVVFAMEDASMEWVLENQTAVLAHSYFLGPSLEAFKICRDKGKTIQLAKEIGIACPETIEVHSEDEFSSAVLKFDRFVLKPKTSSGSRGLFYDKKPAGELLKQYFNYIVQERIPAEGAAIGVSLLFDRSGECKAHFTHKRLRQYPNSGGPSTDRESIFAPELLEQSIALIKKLRWHGVAMVEWKFDLRDKKYKLMEVNPRFWGSLELATRSGVDFPLLYARAAQGEELCVAPSYKPGVRCRWLVPGDVLRYVSTEKNQREGFKEFFKGLPYSAEEWDKRDILGAFSMVVCTLALAINPRYWKYLKKSGPPF